MNNITTTTSSDINNTLKMVQETLETEAFYWVKASRRGLNCKAVMAAASWDDLQVDQQELVLREFRDLMAERIIGYLHNGQPRPSLPGFHLKTLIGVFEMECGSLEPHPKQLARLAKEDQEMFLHTACEDDAGHLCGWVYAGKTEGCKASGSQVKPMEPAPPCEECGGPQTWEISVDGAGNPDAWVAHCPDHGWYGTASEKAYKLI